MADTVYNIAKFDLLKGDMDFDTMTVRMLLVDENFVVEPDDDTVTAAIAGGVEVGESGYTRQTLANVAVTLDDANDRAYVDADDPAFGSIGTGGTIGGGVIYNFVTDDDGSTPICVQDYTNTPQNGQAVSVSFAATGFLMLT